MANAEPKRLLGIKVTLASINTCQICNWGGGGGGGGGGGACLGCHIRKQNMKIDSMDACFFSARNVYYPYE